MRVLKLSRGGFTLIELLLAMGLFTAIMLIATVGFIGMNRTFSRGLIRKQLSEQSQALTSSVTNVIRASSGVNPNNCPVDKPTAGCQGGALQAVCIGSTRFVWPGASAAYPASKKYGLYSQTQKTCTDSFDPTNVASLQGATQIIDNRYKVVSFSVTRVGVDDLYQISGVFRTSDENAFNNPDTANAQCKGSGGSALARSCAVVRINLTVNARKVSNGAST